jgi:hypothetical protein
MDCKSSTDRQAGLTLMALQAFSAGWSRPVNAGAFHLTLEMLGSKLVITLADDGWLITSDFGELRTATEDAALAFIYGQAEKARKRNHGN